MARQISRGSRAYGRSLVNNSLGVTIARQANIYAKWWLFDSLPEQAVISLFT